ncbi:MAG: hypothetical protein GIX03_04880 [Candidatus Eremiobacteraeota bacterium]|nr:hypothetical protein [Candidatus Eremiobacteraeota bacterium]MBC5802331.1 hypothetical protein [Candidatus Eremiobacteraeota bacterium]MBC5822712.1 hypothetical protein [Candidatus Eremiobacteraeota bacterium]
MVAAVLRVTATVLAAADVGSRIGEALSAGSVKRLPPEVFARVQHERIASAGRTLPARRVALLAVLFARALFATRTSRERSLVLAAFATFAGGAYTHARRVVPRERSTARWDVESLPADWQDQRDRLLAARALGTGGDLVALILLVTAAECGASASS